MNDKKGRAKCEVDGSSDSLHLGVDDFDEFGLEGSAAHQETVHVLLGAQFLGGGPGDGTCKKSTREPKPMQDGRQMDGFCFGLGFFPLPHDKPP